LLIVGTKVLLLCGSGPSGRFIRAGSKRCWFRRTFDHIWKHKPLEICRFCGAASDRTCKRCKAARICSQCRPSGTCAEADMAPQHSKLHASSRHACVLLCQASLVAAQVAAGTFKPARPSLKGENKNPSIRLPCAQKSNESHVGPLLEKLPAESPLRAPKCQLLYSEVASAISELASHVAKEARGAAYHRLQLHFMVSTRSVAGMLMLVQSYRALCTSRSFCNQV
jgi:hypothetical protein